MQKDVSRIFEKLLMQLGKDGLQGCALIGATGQTLITYSRLYVISVCV
jgi:hypothetical protein